MEDFEFNFIQEALIYRLSELSADVSALGRPVLVLVSGDEAARTRILRTLVQIPGLVETAIAHAQPSDGKFPVWHRLLDQLPLSGQIRVADSTQLAHLLVNPGWPGLVRSLEADGVLVYAPEAEAGDPASETIRFLEGLIAALELVTDPEQDEEGNEDHEAASLAKRLANPGMSALERRAPPVPAGCRGLPASLIGQSDIAAATLKSPAAAITSRWHAGPLDLAALSKPTLVVDLAIDRVLKKTLDLSPGTLAAIPCISGVLADIHPGPGVTALAKETLDAPETQHHLSTIWAILDQFAQAPEPGILVFKDAWYSQLRVYDGNTDYHAPLVSMRLEEILWLESELERIGIKTLIVPHQV